MNKKLIKIGSFIGFSAALGLTVYNNIKQIKQQQEVIDIEGGVVEEEESSQKIQSPL